MLLKEDYTKDEVQDIFEDMIYQFYEHEYDLDFDIYNVSKILNWLSDRNRKALGKCQYRMNDGRYYIYLNPNLLKFGDDGYKIIKDTIAHELCHTLPGCMNHRSEFHKNARMIGNLMGYKIDTHADEDASAYFRKYLPQTKYKLICTNCGAEIPKPNLCDAVKNPARYNCGKCGGKIDSYILNSSTGEYELYKSYEDDLSYKYKIVCPDCGWEMPFKTRNAKFKNLVWNLEIGNGLGCPKCGKLNLYAVDGDNVVYNYEY